MAEKPNLTKTTLEIILNSNSKLVDFMMQNNLDFMPCKDGVTFCIARTGTNHDGCRPAVTIRWAGGTTYRLKRFGIDSFQMSPDKFAMNRDSLAATAVVSKSIMALYLAACTDIFECPYVKARDSQTGKTVAGPMLSTLREAINCGDISKESIDQAFFFKTNMLPSQIVDSLGWDLPTDFDRLADLSFVWLRNKWCTWANCIEFHEVTPCGSGIYDSAFAEPNPDPLNYAISKGRDFAAIVAMHDKMYPQEAEGFRNEDIFDAVCKDKDK